MTTETRNVDTLTNSATLQANINIPFMSFCQRNRSPIIQLEGKNRPVCKQAGLLHRP